MNNPDTQAFILALPLDQFQEKFGFVPATPLDKHYFAVTGERLEPDDQDRPNLQKLLEENIDLYTINMEPTVPAPQEPAADNREAVFDAEIAPLLTQIRDICNANKIPYLAEFYLGEKDGGSLACGSCILDRKWGTPDAFFEAYRTIHPKSQDVRKAIIAALMEALGE